ncbi:MAG: LPS export ABC transporter permease LptF [Pseudomonadota bacterium]
MKINTIINRHIFREMVPTFFITMAFLTFVFLLAQILEIVNMVVNYRASILSFIFLIVYSMPAFFQFTIPMSVMMAILLTFLRMAGDNEIIAIKVGGGSIYGLLPPVFLFCLIGWFLTLAMTVYGISWGNSSFKKLTVAIASSFTDAALKERVFNDSFDGIMIYVNRIDPKDKTLHDVLIEDQRDEKSRSTVIAPLGKKLFNQDKTALTLRLSNGIINRVNISDNAVHTIRFDNYDIHLDFRKTVQAAQTDTKSKDEMSIEELRAFIQNPETNEAERSNARMELHEKFSIPFACFALGLLAVPLGLKSAFLRQSSGLGLGLFCFLIYYLLLGIGWSSVRSGLCSAFVGMWVPNLFMGAIGLLFLVRVAQEKSIGLDYVSETAYRVWFRMKKNS